MTPYYQHAGITIYCGDCREIAPQIFATSSTSLLLTDPPYGINYSPQQQHYPGAKHFGPITGDTDLELVVWLFQQVLLVPTAIVWGANNFPHLLPFPGTWLCWDKRGGERADRIIGWPFELAWVSKRQRAGRMYRVTHGGAVNADQPNTPRGHPTQKPALLFRKVIADFSSPGDTIFDLFMGSGTTLRAAKDLRRKAIGIEIEEKYCEYAVKMLSQEVLWK